MAMGAAAMSTFRVVKILAKGLVVLDRDGDAAMWSRGVGRKPSKCRITLEAIAPGEECWRPIGNQMYRQERISDEGILELVDAKPIAAKALGMER